MDEHGFSLSRFIPNSSKLGIRTRVLALVAFSAIAPVLLVGGASYLTARKTLVEKVTSELMIQADASAELVRHRLEEQQNDTNIYANSFMVFQNLSRLRSAHSRNDRKSANEARRRIERYLTHILQRRSSCKELLIVDSGGSVLARAGLKIPGQNEDWDTLSTESPKMRWVGNEFYFVTKSPIRTPVGDGLGELLAVDAIADLGDRLTPRLQSESWDFRLIDDTGRPILDSRTDPPDLATDRAAEGVQKCLAGENGITEYEYEGRKRVLGAYRSIAPFGVGLVLEMDVQKAYSTITNLRDLNLLVCALATTLVIALGYILVIGMLRPIEALTRGAMAVSEGDLSIEILVSSDDEIGYLTRVFNKMTSALRTVYNTMEQLSITDELTGLYNRRHLIRAFASELNRVERTGAPLSILILDIDYFKTFNDRFGHLRGDDFLRKVGSFLSSRTRPTDIAVRYGGEEFVLLLPGVDKEQAARKAESLRREFEETRFAGDEFPALTVSIGVATGPHDGRSAEDLMEKVDAALYEAKQEGRNRVIVVAEAAGVR